ncbi:MAG: hypothetical protein U1E76_05955 [Planctomycetota bacterium]
MNGVLPGLDRLSPKRFFILVDPPLQARIGARVGDLIHVVLVLFAISGPRAPRQAACAHSEVKRATRKRSTNGRCRHPHSLGS